MILEIGLHVTLSLGPIRKVLRLQFWELGLRLRRGLHLCLRRFAFRRCSAHSENQVNGLLSL